MVPRHLGQSGSAVFQLYHIRGYGGWHGADADVEELHIVGRHEAHPQTVE